VLVSSTATIATGLDAILPATGRKGLVSEDNQAIYAHFEFYRSCAGFLDAGNNEGLGTFR
jgi:hypothetical protein